MSSKSLIRAGAAVLIAVGLQIPAAAGVADGARAPVAAAWSLGTATKTGTTTSCPVGYTCDTVSVSGCPNVGQAITATVAKSSPSASPRGLVFFFSGAGGTTWWQQGTQGGSIAAAELVKLRDNDHLVIVQVKWKADWYAAQQGVDSGSGHMACRGATLVKWVHDVYYVPLGLSPAPGSCGYCISGNSGGSSEVSYALSHYGLDSILDGVFPTSGPPLAAIVKGCLTTYPGYLYEGTSATSVDKAEGFLSGGGPCSLHDSSYTSRWNTESVDTGGTDYSHPATRIGFIVGAGDHGASPSHAQDYRDKLQLDSANDVSWWVVSGMVHTIQKSQSGLDALRCLILGLSQGC